MATTNKAPTTEDLTAQIETLRGDITQLTKLVGELSKSKGHELTESARRKAESVRASGEAQIAEMQNQALAGYEEAEDYVRRNPATALGLAAGFGVLVGLLTARR